MAVYKHRIQHVGKGMLGVIFSQQDIDRLVRHSFDCLTGGLKGDFIIERQDPETKEWTELTKITKSYNV